MQGGKAIIKGTRIPVCTIVIWYKAGKEIFEILDMYPQIKPSQLHDAPSYIYVQEFQFCRDALLCV
jgi:uncharacterized protein (DUF433 family)